MAECYIILFQVEQYGMSANVIYVSGHVLWKTTTPEITIEICC